MGKRMKIVLAASTNRGGQWVQATNTAQYLCKHGHTVDLKVGQWTIPRDASLVHAFSTACLPAVRAAKSLGKPTVLSPIFWPKLHYLQQREHADFLQPWERRLVQLRHSWPGRICLDSRRMGAQALSPRYSGLVGSAFMGLEKARDCFRLADFLLPDSETEMRVIEAVLGVCAPYRVVPMGIEKDLFRGDEESIAGRAPKKGNLLSVSLVSTHKNTLSLIRAANHLNLPLLLVGPMQDSNYLERKYVAACKREAGSNITFAGPVPYSGLPSIYKNARVHALVSWYEIPGLVSLEAAALGCSIVSTALGTASDYLQDDAEYCDPGNQRSIEEAIGRAWESLPSNRLGERIRTTYTWQRTAALTVQAYEELLNQGYQL